MRCTRALPTNQLMPAASSRNPPAATHLPGERPEKNERPRPFGCPHTGHPFHHHVAGSSPCTQIRLSVGTPVSRTTISHRRQQMS